MPAGRGGTWRQRRRGPSFRAGKTGFLLLCCVTLGKCLPLSELQLAQCKEVLRTASTGLGAATGAQHSKTAMLSSMPTACQALCQTLQVCVFLKSSAEK